MKIIQFVNGLLMMFLSINCVAQPLNNNCSNAVDLCPNVSESGTTVGSNGTLCPDCEDDFSFCFSGQNTVWYMFTTNASGGDINVLINNLVFTPQANRGTELQALVVSAIVGCDASTYVPVSNCMIGSSVGFNLFCAGLNSFSTYYIIIQGAKNGGATLPADATFNVTASGPGIDRLPVTSSIGGPGVICPETAVGYQLYLANCQDTSNIRWFVNGTLAAQTPNAYWYTSSLNNGDVISASCDCFSVCTESTFSFGPVISEIIFTLDAGNDQNVAAGSVIQLNGTTNGDTAYWSGINLPFEPGELSTSWVANNNTLFTLTATLGSCSLSDQIMISISNLLNIPGSFSPNQDGANDFFYIEGIENYPNNVITFFNRWGSEVGSITGYSAVKAWDGSNNGKKLPDGTYFYTIDFFTQPKKESLKGYVSIIR